MTKCKGDFELSQLAIVTYFFVQNSVKIPQWNFLILALVSDLELSQNVKTYSYRFQDQSERWVDWVDWIVLCGQISDQTIADEVLPAHHGVISGKTVLHYSTWNEDNRLTFRNYKRTVWSQRRRVLKRFRKSIKTFDLPQFLRRSIIIINVFSMY